MSAPPATPNYGRLLDFYEDAYANALQEVRFVGRIGGQLLQTRQDPGDWSDAPHPDLAIIRVLRRAVPATVDLGAGRFRTTYQPNSFVVVPPGTPATFLCDTPHELRILALPYAALRDWVGLEGGLPDDGNFGRLHREASLDLGIVALQDRLWKEAVTGRPGGLLLCDGLVLQIAAALHRLSGTAPSSARVGLTPWQERRCREYLEEHAAEDVPLADLARLAGLSVFHFARMFKRSFGLPPHAYQRRLRCERAQALLRDTDLPVTAVARAVGYATPQAFAGMFIAETGASPSAWRREATR